MGIIPLQFLPGQTPDTLKLTGREVYDIHIPEDAKPKQKITVEVSWGALVSEERWIRLRMEVQFTPCSCAGR